VGIPCLAGKRILEWARLGPQLRLSFSVRSALLSRRTILIAAISFLVPLGVYLGWSQTGEAPTRSRDLAALDVATARAESPPNPAAWQDSFGDGFPDAARLADPRDRENFVRWATFLAEALYYRRSPRALEEVQDCAALVRYAYRNALMAHPSAWRRSAELPFDPGFGDVREFSYPQWPLGRGLFRTRPGPFARPDVQNGAFAEFADAASLLHFNTFAVSRDVAAAQPGDLLFFYQRGQNQPYHSMMFVGVSHFQPQGDDWLIYHTGDLSGAGGEVRHLRVSILMQHPEPRWRPVAANPAFLGVYRFNLLR
jgi:uncharacterized protein YfaT (DUF1175 family)